jgi:chorismate mutase
LEEDQYNFIHTMRRSISFPVGQLAELLSRRVATAEEVAAWRSLPDDEDLT